MQNTCFYPEWQQIISEKNMRRRKGEESKQNKRGRDLTSNQLRKLQACCTKRSQMSLKKVLI